MTTVGVSIVLTDLVGSTDLSTRVGAETADRLRREHFGLLRDAIAAHGGREVKNLGDGVTAVFPGVAGAADAAVAIQQAFARRNADAEEPLLIRIGVSSGDCTEEDDDFFGEPVVQAARLCAQAEGGRILAADVVRLLAPRGRHEFVRLGERELKGLPEPVAVVEIVVPVAAAGAVDPDVPLPARLQSRGGLAFVGRAAERGQLDAARRAVAAGARRIVLVSGEAGLGKTRLVSACAADAREAGAIVAYGRCDEEIGRQYGPWAEAIAHLAAHLPAELLAGLDVRSLARLAPGLASAAAVEAGPADVDGEEFVLFAAVTDFLAKVARAAPLVIVLDDLHWADRGTLLLLRHVAAATLSDRLLILATFRDTDSDPDGPLAATVAALHREEGSFDSRSTASRRVTSPNS